MALALVLVLVLEEERWKREDMREVRYKSAVSCVSKAWYWIGPLPLDEAIREARRLECIGWGRR